jgi:hypothetical protein
VLKYAHTRCASRHRADAWPRRHKKGVRRWWFERNEIEWVRLEIRSFRSSTPSPSLLPCAPPTERLPHASPRTPCMRRKGEIRSAPRHEREHEFEGRWGQSVPVLPEVVRFAARHSTRPSHPSAASAPCPHGTPSVNFLNSSRSYPSTTLFPALDLDADVGSGRGSTTFQGPSMVVLHATKRYICDLWVPRSVLCARVRLFMSHYHVFTPAFNRHSSHTGSRQLLPTSASGKAARKR